MKDLVELKEEKSHKLRTCEDIMNAADKADRVMTDDEKQLTDGLMKDAAALQEEIEAIEDHQRRVEALQTKITGLKGASPRKADPVDVSDPSPGKIRVEVPSHQLRYGKLKAFGGPDAELRAYKAGMWARAAIFRDHRAQKWCQQNGIAFHNVMSEGTNSAGGYLVPEEMSQAIIDLRERYGVFRQHCDVMPMGSDTMTVPRRAGGVSASFVDESGELSESDPSFDQVRLTAKKLGVFTRMSSEVSEDATINLGDWIANEFAYAFALKEDQCGFIGDGTATYGGIVGVAKKFENNTSLAGSVAAATATHDTFPEIDQTDLATLMSKLPQYARMNAKFICSQVAFDLVFGRIAAAAGGNTVQTLTGEYRPSYLGYPIVVSQVLNAGVSTDYSNLHMILFGDLSKAATLGERRGITVSTSTDRYWELDQIGVKATSRIDINVHDVGDTTNAGPIVCLLGGAS